MKKLRQAIHGLNCKVCGDKFETTATWGKYCSPACRQKAYRNRREKDSASIVTQLHNVVTVLRNENVTDSCKNCQGSRTLLEQTVNRSMCFDCFAPNWGVIKSIKDGVYNESMYPNEPLILQVKNGEWDDFLKEE